jgi:hypothetical protein
MLSEHLQAFHGHFGGIHEGSCAAFMARQRSGTAERH